MSVGATIALGALLGLALGIIVSVTTDLPLDKAEVTGSSPVSPTFGIHRICGRFRR